MKFTETKLEGAYLIGPDCLEDERGFFARTFCQEEFKKHGLSLNIVQCNVSFNKKKGTLRGMHYQVAPCEEAKVVSCIRGAIYDVILDLRQDSPTYYQWFAMELSAENYKMLYVPGGFAHGFQTLTDECFLQYFMFEFYSPEHASGVRWNDPFFNISWPIKNPTMVSKNDQNWPLVKQV